MLGSTVDVFSRATQKQIGPSAPALLDVFVYFNLIPNTIFLPILVAIFLFSKRAKRHPTLVNVCMTWILGALFSLLLFFAGRHRPTDPEPSTPLCVIQASLLYGITPMWSVALLILIYHMIVVNSNRGAVGGVRMVLMLCAPYVVYLAFTIATLALAIQNPGLVSRSRRFFYCSIKYDYLAYGMGAFTFLVCVVILVLQVYLGVVLYRNWRGIKRSGMRPGVELYLIVRIIVFGVFVLLGMIANIIAMIDSSSVLPDMYAATIGTVVLLVFGSQPAVIRALRFWRDDREIPQPISIPSAHSGEFVDLVKSAAILVDKEEDQVFYPQEPLPMRRPPRPPSLVLGGPLVPNRYIIT